MSFNGLFNPLRLNADVSLCHGGAAVLQETLYKRNVIAVVSVNLCCVPLAEAVCADSLKAQIIAHDGKLLLNCPCGDRKDQIGAAYAVAQTVVFDVT